MKKTIFLDRDGVINKAIVLNGKPYPPPNLDDVKICKGVRESMDLMGQNILQNFYKVL